MRLNWQVQISFSAYGLKKRMIPDFNLREIMRKLEKQTEGLLVYLVVLSRKEDQFVEMATKCSLGPIRPF